MNECDEAVCFKFVTNFWIFQEASHVFKKDYVIITQQKEAAPIYFFTPFYLCEMRNLY